MTNSIRPLNLINRIAQDLQTGTLPFPASEDLVRQNYARVPGEVPWLEYRHAVRLVGATDGTLVVVDDTRECFVAATDFDGECIEATETIFLSATGTRYRSIVNADHLANGFRLTLWRLPRGDYADKPHAFFEKHGDYCRERRMRTLKATSS